MVAGLATSTPRQRLAGGLRLAALVSAAIYIVLLVGANSVALTGGPLTWLPLWRLPSAAGMWVSIGPVTLLPALSLSCWVASRIAGEGWRAVSFGWKPVVWPFALLCIWSLASVLVRCASGSCEAGTLVRLVMLIALFGWLYLLIVNEEPDLLWVLVPILVLQSSVAIGQFVIQQDLGLHWLGELNLDPTVRGTSIVMNGEQRWLRGYGLTTHPNSLARTLTLSWFMLLVLTHKRQGLARTIAIAALVVGGGGLLATLSRWSWITLAICLGIMLVPYALALAQARTVPRLSRPALLAAAALAIVLILFGVVYGGAVFGRFFDLGNPVESFSRFERLRDMQVSWQVIQTSPVTGVGPGGYLQSAIAVLPSAKLVPSVPLFVAGELGLVGVFLWLIWLVWPLARPGAFIVFVPESALWICVFLIGLFYVNPNPLYELRSALLVAMAAAIVSVPRGAYEQSVKARGA